MGIAVFGVVKLDAGEISPRERTVLAALILRLGAPVSAGELAEAVWPGGRPATWAKQVQTSVVRLRRVLGHEAVQTAAAGYVLRVGAEEIDVVRFERLVTAARERAVAAEPDRAVDLLGRALGLWRGRPYADLGDWDPAVAEAARLEEIRRDAEEDLLEAHLACGEHRSVAAEAERLVREEPLREGRWALWAIALYRSGRQADGLAALRQARARFAEELGLK